MIFWEMMIFLGEYYRNKISPGHQNLYRVTPAGIDNAS